MPSDVLPGARTIEHSVSHSVSYPTARSDIHVLTAVDSKRCRCLMAKIIEYFTPILFTPPATPHMECTDIIAETWMTLVIQPALGSDGVYKPLETLEQMKNVNWAKNGLCASCVREKREEWTTEQELVWKRVDDWLDLRTENPMQ
jgi:hypothetical protein